MTKVGEPSVFVIKTYTKLSFKEHAGESHVSLSCSASVDGLALAILAILIHATMIEVTAALLSLTPAGGVGSVVDGPFPMSL